MASDSGSIGQLSEQRIDVSRTLREQQHRVELFLSRRVQRSGPANRARKQWSLLDQLMLRNFFCGDRPAELISSLFGTGNAWQTTIHAQRDSRSLRITLPGNPNAFNFVSSPAMLHDNYEPRPLMSEKFGRDCATLPKFSFLFLNIDQHFA